MLLSGCAELFLQPYGYVATDTDNVREDGRPAYLPEGAPSISQGYRPRPSDDSIIRAGHEGIDIYAKTGTPVIAPAAGTVSDSYFEPFYGNHIVIEHGRNEDGNVVISKFMHLDKRLVTKGEKVVRGQQLGTIGSTGILASYPHLHFEIRTSDHRRYSSPSNPHRFWADGAGMVTCFDESIELPDVPFRTTYPVPCR